MKSDSEKYTDSKILFENITKKKRFRLSEIKESLFYFNIEGSLVGYNGPTGHIGGENCGGGGGSCGGGCSVSIKE